jgi:hypothetical protein
MNKASVTGKILKYKIRTLQDLIRKHGKGDTKALQKAYKSVRILVDIKG